MHDDLYVGSQRIVTAMLCFQSVCVLIMRVAWLSSCCIELLFTKTGIDSQPGTLLTCMSPQLVQWLKMGCQGGPTHHAPYIASPSVVSSNHQAAIQSNGDAADSCADFWHELTAACICCQVPHSDVAVLITCRQQLYAGTECQQRGDLC